MYSRTAKLSVIESTDDDFSKLRNFADTIFYNPMYESIALQLKSRPGFLQKSHAMVDTKNTVLLISQVVFENKETFDVYALDPATINLWEYLVQLCKDEGMNVEVKDSEIVLGYDI